MGWIKVKNIKPYVKSGDYVSDEEDHTLSRSLYSMDGKKYPVFSIAIHADPHHVVNGLPLTGIKISSSYKDKEGKWWESLSTESYIPQELWDDVIEMINIAKKKYEK